MNYSLKMTAENGLQRFLLIVKPDGIYKISEVLYHMLHCYQINNDYSVIAATMNKRYATSGFTMAFVEETIQTIVQNIEASNTAFFSSEGKYIYAKIPVVKGHQLHHAYNILSVLFRKPVLIASFLLSLFITAFFLYDNGLLSLSAMYNTAMDSLSLHNIIAIYIGFIGIILLHEIGHATASYSLGIDPKEIGFGFYFVFPVFYTDVTNIWTLSARQRNVVNLGGIYFQMLLNVAFIACYILDFFPSVAAIFIIGNTASIIMSLIPFFRYDGYWLFSDSFNVPNLQYKSWEWWMIFLFSKSTTWKKELTSMPVALWVYAIASFLFWSYVYIYMGQYLWHSSATLYQLVINNNPVQVKEILGFCMILLTIFLLVRQIINTIKSLHYEAKNIDR